MWASDWSNSSGKTIFLSYFIQAAPSLHIAFSWQERLLHGQACYTLHAPDYNP